MHNAILYPGTFDPITLGHVDIVMRAANMFERVIVAVANDPSNKTTLLNLDERLSLASQSFELMPNVDVMGFSGLLVEFAKAQDVNLVLRGVRASTDFEFEMQLASMNRMMLSSLETIFLTPCAEYAYVSSSLVRDVAKHKGELRSFVAPHVQAVLEAKFKA